jgi:hypothetical protein
LQATHPPQVAPNTSRLVMRISLKAKVESGKFKVNPGGRTLNRPCKGDKKPPSQRLEICGSSLFFSPVTLHFSLWVCLLFAAFLGRRKTTNDFVQGSDKHHRQDQRHEHLLTTRIGEIPVRPGQLTSSDQVCRAREGDQRKDDSGDVWQATDGLGLVTALHQAHMLRIQLLWLSRKTFTIARSLPRLWFGGSSAVARLNWLAQVALNVFSAARRIPRA